MIQEEGQTAISWTTKRVWDKQGFTSLVTFTHLGEDFSFFRRITTLWGCSLSPLVCTY